MNSLFDFAPFITEANPEHWEGFPELMWNLGFEMDCYASAPRFDTYTYPTHTNKEIQDDFAKYDYKSKKDSKQVVVDEDRNRLNYFAIFQITQDKEILKVRAGADFL